MNYPFFRYIEYWDDGHEIYQCLNCGKKIDVGHHYSCFSPRYCCFCGVEYKGYMLPKKYEYIKVESTSEQFIYQIMEGVKWDDDDNDISWSNTWRKTNDPKLAVKYLKDQRRVREEESKKREEYEFSFIYISKIEISKEPKGSEYIKLDCDEYHRRTGKKFDIHEYNKRTNREY